MQKVCVFLFALVGLMFSVESNLKAILRVFMLRAGTLRSSNREHELL